jgi:hypothetical protein
MLVDFWRELVACKELLVLSADVVSAISSVALQEGTISINIAFSLFSYPRK